jgi:hypothetical protein
MVVQVMTKVSIIQKMVTAVLWFWQICLPGLKCHLNINCIVISHFQKVPVWVTVYSQPLIHRTEWHP